MGHTIYGFHHHHIFFRRKKKKKTVWELSWTGMLNRTASCLPKEIVCLNSTHTGRKISLMGSLPKLSHFSIHLSFPINEQASYDANIWIKDISIENTLNKSGTEKQPGTIFARETVALWWGSCLDLLWRSYLLGSARATTVGRTVFCEYCLEQRVSNVCKRARRPREMEHIHSSDHKIQAQYTKMPAVAIWVVESWVTFKFFFLYFALFSSFSQWLCFVKN